MWENDRSNGEINETWSWNTWLCDNIWGEISSYAMYIYPQIYFTYDI